MQVDSHVVAEPMDWSEALAVREEFDWNGVDVDPIVIGRVDQRASMFEGI